MPQKDLFGNALLDYHSGNYTEDVMTWTNISDRDKLPLPYLFREFGEMPKLEQQALALCKGKILDVGCGAGNHSLYVQENGLNLTAIDISKGAVEVATQRGVQNVQQKALLEVTTQFDTILLLMNGTGIFKNMQELPNYLRHLKSLLRPNGQILIDSSDINYMYDEEDLTALKNEHRYYGKLDYFLSYKGEKAAPMQWLYLDFDTLQKACTNVGLQCTKIMDGEHYDYLAKIDIA